MKTLQHIFQLNLSAKEVVMAKRIMAIVMMPILVFYMTSMNFLMMGMMQANAADGSGTMTVNDDKVTAGAAAQNFKFTFDPSEDMDGGSVRVEFPSPFPTPSLSGGDGAVTVEGKSGAVLGDATRDGRQITIPITTMSANQYFIVNYNVTSVMPTTIGDYEFTTESKLTGGSFSDLGSSRQASVEIEPGVVDHYIISAITDKTVGVDFNVTVTAEDANNNTTTGSGSVAISVQTGSGALVGDTSADTSSDGDDTVTLKYNKVEDNVVLRASADGKTGDSNAFDVDNISKPTLSSPAAGAYSNDPTPAFDWSTVSGTSIVYSFQLDTTDQFDSANLLEKTSLADSGYALDASESLGNDDTYYWRVKAIDDYDNDSDWTTARSFEYQTSPPDSPNGVSVSATASNPINYINKYTTSSVTATVTVPDDDTINTGSVVYVRLTDSADNTVTGSKTYTGDPSVTSFDVTGINANSLQQGSITVEARIVDRFGNQNSGGYVSGTSATKDITPAAVPSLIDEADEADSTPELTWTTVDGADSYDIQVDNNSNFASPEVNEDELTGTSFVTDALADGTYYWRMRSSDIAWNKSNWGVPTDTSFKVDVTAPSVNAGTDKTVKAVVSQDATVTDATTGMVGGLAGYQWEQISGPDGGTVTFGTSTLEDTTISANVDGTYGIRLTATDAVGNDASDEMTLIWDTVNPSGSITAPANNSYYSSNPTYTADATDTTAGVKSVKFQYKASTAEVWTDLNTDTESSYAADWTGVTLVNGTVYNLQIVVTDNAENSVTVGGVSFTYDTSAPAVAVLTPSDAGIILKGGQTYDITWTATDTNMAVNPITLAYSTNGTDWTEIANTEANDGTYVWTVPSIDSATVKVKVVAVDLTSLVGNDVSNNEFRIDSTKPTSVVSTTGQLTDAEYADKITGTASDAGSGVASVDISIQRTSDSHYWDGADWDADTVQWLSTGDTVAWEYDFIAADGATYNIQSRATDISGNIQTELGSGSFTYDTTAPASVATIASDTYGPTAWLNDTTINGTASDSTTGVAGVTITIGKTGGTFWTGADWGASTPLPVTLVDAGGGNYTWSYSLDKTKLNDGVTYTITPTATDGAGNVVAGTADSFSYDDSPPTAATIVIASGDVVTKDSTPELVLTAGASVPNFMRFSCNNSDWSEWTAWATSYNAFNVTSGAGCSADDGIKTIYVSVKDNDGNIQPTINSDSIVYDSNNTLTVDYSGGKDFTTIQAAIDAATANDTIDVAAGTYAEVGQIVINKNLSIVGADKATTIIKPNADTAASGDAGGWWLVDQSIIFNLSGVTLDGDGYKISSGIRHKGTGTIQNVHFKNITYDYAGFAIYAFIGYLGGSGAVDVSNCQFDNIGRVGITYYGAGTTGTYTGNTYTGKGLGNWLDYGVEVSAGAVVTISDSTITNNRGVATVDGSNSAGIIVLLNSEATITGNTITGNYYGINVGNATGTETPVAHAHNNNISGNYGLDARHASAYGTFDATENWWGSAQKTDVISKISAYVSYAPWYLNSGKTILSDTDNTGPTVVLTNNISERTQVRNADNVTITATFSDDNGLDTGVTPTISIDYADGTADISNAVMTGSGNTWTYVWDVPAGDTTAAVSVSAKDIVGNNNSAATGITSYTIDNTKPDAPVVTFTDPVNGINKTNTTLTISGTTGTTYNYTIADVGSAHTLTGSGSLSSSPLNINGLDISGFVDGAVTANVTLTDTAGNVSDAGTDNVTMDTAAPIAPVITSIATDNVISNVEKGAVHVIGTAEAGSTINVSLISGATVSNSGTAAGGNFDITVDTSTLTDGTVTPSVTATDAAGNVSSAATTPTATQDTVNPAISRSTIQASAASANGYIKQGDTYYIYAEVTDATSGVNAVTANVANIAVGETAVALIYNVDGYTIGAQTYHYRSAQKTADNPLAEGNKSYTVDANDNAGNNATQLTSGILVDNSTPNDPSMDFYNSSAKGSSLTTDTWYNFSLPYAEWAVPTENPATNSGVAGYYVCVDEVGTCNPSEYQTSRNYTLSGLVTGHTYYVRAKVKDNAGNVSGAAPMFIYKYDNTNPTAGTVTDDGVWTNSSTTLHATWAGFTDTSGVTLYQYSIGTTVGGTEVKEWTGNGTTAEITEAGLTLSSGNIYYINVRAYDQAGNVSDVSSSNGITVDTQAPVGTVAAVDTYSKETFTVSWSGSSDVGPSGLNGHYKVKYKDQADGSWTDWLADTTLTSATFGAGNSPIALVSGHTYYFEVGAQDNAGNWETFVGNSGEDAILYDETAPNNPTVNGYQTSAKTVSLPTNNWYNYSTPYFEWSAPQDLPTDAGFGNSGIAGYYVYFGTNAGADPVISGTWQTELNYTVGTAMTSGQTAYLITKTKDTAGNVSAAATVFIYKYDTDAPDTVGIPVNGWSDNLRTTAITSGSWYNYTRPYFEWAASIDNPETNAGVRAYYKYFGANATEENFTGNYAVGLTFEPNALSSSATKYLRIRTIDNADVNATGSPIGNISSAVTGFTYNFDEDIPTTSVTTVTPVFDAATDYIKGDVIISGTSADTGGSGVSRTYVQIKDVTAEPNLYWTGTVWQESEAWIDTGDAANWDYATSSLNLTDKDGHTLEIKSKAYDSVNGGGTNGNAGTSSAYSVIVDLAGPVFETNNSTADATTGDDFTFSQDVTDADSGVNYSKVEYWYGTGEHIVSTMLLVSSNTYEHTVTIPSDSLDTLHYFFKSQDNVGNTEVTTAQVDEVVTDNDDPNVNVTTENTTAAAGSSVTLRADITDNIGVDGVVLHYKSYGGNWNTKNMSRYDGNDQDGKWQTSIDAQQSLSGKMEYYVTTDDAADNDDTDDNDEANFKITITAAELDHYEVYSDVNPLVFNEFGSASFIVTVVAKDEFGNNKNNEETANITVRGYSGGEYVALTNYTASPAAITFTNNALKSTTITITGTGGTPFDQIQVVATTGSVIGLTEIDAIGFEAAVAGTTSTNSDGNVGGVNDQGLAPAEESAPIAPWLPYAEGAAVLMLIAGGAWWWVRRGGSGVLGGGGSNNMMFYSLKNAASKIRMFFW